MTENKYDDIINLPYRRSATRKHMPVSDRAAQFAPFAALTGYDDAVREAARITDRKIELDDYEKEKINNTLLYIKERIEEGLLIEITYFVPDDKKSGGEYLTKQGRIKKLADFEGIIELDGGAEIFVGNVTEIKILTNRAK